MPRGVHKRGTGSCPGRVLGPEFGSWPGVKTLPAAGRRAAAWYVVILCEVEYFGRRLDTRIPMEVFERTLLIHGCLHSKTVAAATMQVLHPSFQHPAGSQAPWCVLTRDTAIVGTRTSSCTEYGASPICCIESRHPIIIVSVLFVESCMQSLL